MWIIFEDSDNTPISDLISYAYSNVDVNLIFAGGAGNFFKYVSKIPENEFVVILFDLIPDNPDTATGFRNLKRKLRKRDKVFIIPTLSMDYMLLKAFTNKEVNPYKIVSSNYRINSEVKTLEKYYKYILDTSDECLSLGRFTSITENTAMFYKTDCLCKLSNNQCHNYTRFNKGLDLLYSMPFFYDIDCNKPSQRFDINKYIERFINLYNEVVSLVAENDGWSKPKITKAIIL